MKKIRMYSSYTDSHAEMFERFFEPTVPESFELCAFKFDQECPTGEYHSKGWVQAVARKIEVIRDGIERAIEEGDDFIMFSDCDIQYFEDCAQDITRLMQYHDFIAQDDDVYCTGFMAIRCDDRARFMWKWCAENLEKYGCDQPTGNAFIKYHQRYTIRAKMLPKPLWFGAMKEHAEAGEMRFGKFPRMEYFNHMHLGTEPAVWDGESEIKVSPEQLSRMRMMHANYTQGIENKIKLLELFAELKRTHAAKASGHTEAKASVPETVSAS